MKEFKKKLNNFRLTTFIMAGIAVLGIIVTLLFFVAYQTATSGSEILFAQRDTTILHNAFPDKPILGFIFFMAAFLAIILGVAVVAFCLPFIMPKEKGVPSRTIGWVLVAQQVFLLVLVVLGVLALITSVRNTSILLYNFDAEEGAWVSFVQDTSKAIKGGFAYVKDGDNYIAQTGIIGPINTILNKPFWIINIALGVIVIAAGAFMAYPNAVCDFYCPEVMTEAEEKARKEARKAARAEKKAAKEAA